HVAAVAVTVPVRQKLQRRVACGAKAKPVNHVVEPRLEQLEQRFTSHATLAQRAVENPAELALEQPVLITKFLFLAERDGVIGLLPARASWSVHSRRIIFPLKRF